MKRYYSLLLVIAAALTTACNVDTAVGPLEDGNMIPLNIDGAIKQIQTRATAEGFVDGDAVGLFAVNYTDNNTAAGSLQVSGNQADNVKYIFDETNHKWAPVRPVYYKNINTHADLYLYYPYQGTITDVNAANFEVNKDQSSAATATALSGYEASDWMWGKGTDVTPTESKVRVQLAHRFSAVQVTLKEGTGFESGEFASLNKNVILTGTTRKATLDFATGSVTPVGSAQLDGIVMCPQNDGTWRAVVIPQTVATGTRLFSITIGGISYDYSQADAVNYQQGKQMNVTLTINKKTPGGDYEITLGGTTITDWTEDRNTHGGEARQYYVVNVTTPGTLGDLIAAAGKSPAKIRNLKVTGTVNANDFYFMRDNMDILEAVNAKECSVVDNKIPQGAFQNKKTLTYFVFPESIVEICSSAFAGSNLSGALIIPDGVLSIGGSAFSNTLIGSLQLSNSLIEIGSSAFSGCNSVSGPLLFPETLVRIGGSAFYGCEGFSGRLQLPNSLEEIGAVAFYRCGHFIGDLIIPEKIERIGGGTFQETTFTGHLILSNVQELGANAFSCCWGLNGDLIIPEGVIEIPDFCFYDLDFTTLKLPSTIKSIGEHSFYDCSFIDPIIFPEGLITIKKYAFSGCSFLTGLSLPETIQTLQEAAFSGCNGINSLICKAVEPPSLQQWAFSYVPTDNFTVEVPAQSVKRYQAEPGWSDFKRIAAHYDFSISRTMIQALNAEYSRTLTLRVPAGFDWSIQSKPDWVNVSPSSGTGKTDVTITVSAMTRTNDTFEVNEGTFYTPSWVNYKGRSGEVVFLLDDKDYTSTLTVEQYDSDYTDGSVQILQSSTQGQGIDIVFTGDGYSARDIAKGTFTNNATGGYGHFFDVEPYKTYKNYFNVYTVIALSNDSGIETENTVIDTKFGSKLTSNRILLLNPDGVFNWAKRADAGMNLSKSLVILLQNTSTYEGITLMYTDGSALAVCPVSTDAYPYDYRGIIQHEAGGHGFGKLGDEYIHHSTFINNCTCICCEHPQSDEDFWTSYGVYKSLDWYKNLSMNGDMKQVPWAHLIYNPQYSDYVDMYEGGYMHSRGMFRSEATSCMNNNIPYFSAISRQAIVERIMYCAGQEFSLADFYANDNDDFGPITKAGTVDRTFGVDPDFVRATGQGPILMGEHPNVQ